MKVYFLFKHIYGHHMDFPEPIIGYLRSKGYSIVIVGRPEVIGFVKEKKPSFASEYMVVKCPYLFVFYYLWLRVKFENEACVFLHTAEEWVLESVLTPAPLLRKMRAVGVLHYVVKDREKKLPCLIYNWISEKLWLPKVKSVATLMPLTEHIKKNANLAVDVFSYFPSGGANTDSVNGGSDGSISVLIFGAIRKNKDIVGLVKKLHCLSFSDRLRFKIYGRPMDRCTADSIERELGGQANVEICYDYIGDEQKDELLRSADVIGVPNVGSDFAGRMISGVLNEAILYCKPVISLVDLPLPHSKHTTISEFDRDISYDAFCALLDDARKQTAVTRKTMVELFNTHMDGLIQKWK